MMRLYRTLLLAVALVGCRVTPEATILPTAPVDAPAVVPAALADAPVQGMPGKVMVSIQWPGGGARAVQAMPDSVQGVRVAIEKVAGQPLAAQWVKRGFSLVTTVALEAPSGEGYRIRAAAYTGWNETDPGKLVADGVVVQVAVPWGKVARVTLDLVPVNMPRIVSLDLAAAGPGAQLELGVAGAGESTAGVVIFPSGREVEVALGSGAASVKVPQDAGVGALRLRVDGIVSAQGPLFRQLRALRVVVDDDPSNELPGPRNDPDDTAIHLWPGAAAPLTVAGTDVDGADVPEVRGVEWVKAQAGPYLLSSAGRVACLGLGAGKVRAVSGGLSVDRDLELSPLEGPRYMVAAADAGNACPRAVVLDENRLLVFWRNEAAAKVRWHIVRRAPDGSLSRDSVDREVTAAGMSGEKAVVGAKGQSMVLLLHRIGVVTDAATGRVQNSFAIRAINPVDGALFDKPTATRTPKETYDGYRLGAVAAQGDVFQIAYGFWNGTVYENQWLNLGIGPQPDGSRSVNTQGGTPKAARGPMVDNPDVIALPDGGFMVVGTYPDGEAHLLQMSVLDSTGSAIAERSRAYYYDRPMYQPSVAYDDNNYAVVWYTDGTAGPSVELGRYEKATLKSLDPAANFIEAVNVPSWVVGNKPTSALYDPAAGRFVIGYARAVPGMVPTGVTEGYQSVVRIIDPTTGKPEGPSFPMQARSHSGTVVPGWAVYMRDGAVMVRHLKLK
jgi:hypothetical protein